MHAKIAIFVIISAVFAASISTAISNSPVAFAATACFKVKGTETHFCTSSVSEKWYECTLDKDGVRRCVEVKAVIDNSIPPDLKDAIDIATEESQSNDTKVPRGDFLEDRDLLIDDSTDTNDDGKGPNDLGGLNDDDYGDAPTINPGQ